MDVMIKGTSHFKWSETCGLPNSKTDKLCTCAHYAVQNRDLRVVDRALEDIQKEGFTIPSFPRDAKGNTLLHHATLFGSPETIKKLLLLKANKDAQNNHGWTPVKNLKWRLRSGRIKVDKELFEMMETPVPFYYLWKERLKKLINFFGSSK